MPLARGNRRAVVYDVIDGERDYQNALPDSRTDGADRSVGDYIVMAERYMRKAIDAWTDNPGNGPALHQLRKVAAICVRCMEEHGAPSREMESL